MRMLLAVALALSVPLALPAPADAGNRKAKSVAKHERYSHLPASERPPRNAAEAAECARARHADPTGLYKHYPCWAREALSQTGGDVWW